MRRSLALVAGVIVVVAGCGGDDDDTLEPLPIVGGTVAASTTSSAPSVVADTTTTLPRAPIGDPSGTTVPAAQVGDWDGARFDVGVIESVSALGPYTAIELDRWSYTRPDGVTVDAAGLDAEPLVGWWRTSPFGNVRVQTRTFVLAADVEVLTLDPAGRAGACADPPPALPPAPAWVPSGTSDLGAMADGEIAILTYATADSGTTPGLVTRIRLTRGC